MQLILAFVFRFGKANIFLVWYPVVLLQNGELVEVHVGPSHDHLQNSVKFGEGNIAFHLNAAPNGVAASQRG